MKYLLIALCILTCSLLRAQSTFTSIERRDYDYSPSKLIFRRSMAVSCEIEFHLKRNYIVLRDNDADKEYVYVNAVPAEHKDTWQAYSVKSKRNCLFIVDISDKHHEVAIFDGAMAYYYTVNNAYLNSN